MMMIPVEVRKSEIHGYGIFAIANIPEGAVLWAFVPGLDHMVSGYAVKYGDPRASSYIQERGYLSPEKPNVWVICVDEAQFWNFPKRGEEANCRLGGELDGEKLIMADRDIKVGEELTVPPESDADYDRKMETR
jgi:hypothetical protein